VNGITPTTVNSDRPGMSVSVIDGGPSKKVCSGTTMAAGAGPLIFCFGSLDFFGRAFDGCGLYAQRTADGVLEAPADARSCSGALPESANDVVLVRAPNTTRTEYII